MNIKTNYVGYLPVLRAVLMLLRDGFLSIGELGAYLAFVTQADYDKKHRNYGAIIRDDKELAKEWGCDPATIFRKRKKLIEKGLLFEEGGFTKVTGIRAFEANYAKLLAKIPANNLQTIFTKRQDEIDEMQDILTKMQKD